MVFWSLAVQSIKFVSWLNFSEMGGSIFPDCWFSQAVISTYHLTGANQTIKRSKSVHPFS